MTSAPLTAMHPKCPPPPCPATRAPRPILALATLALLSCLATTLPAAAQGSLANGGAGTGAISVGGEADNWTFDAPAGAGVMFRVGSAVLTPRIRIFGPDNAQLEESTWSSASTRDGFVTLQAPSAGTYTAVVSAAYPAQTGEYRVSLAVAPAAITVPANDEGGDLINATAHTGTLSVGDLDVWGFNAAGGETFFVRAGSDDATPWLRVYQPDGALIAQSTWASSAVRDGFITVRLTNAGPHTVVISAAYAGQSGAYSLTGVRAPGALVISEGDEGGDLPNGVSTPGNLPRGDADAWTFQGNAGDTVTLRTGSPDFTPWIRLFAPSGDLVDQSDWSSSATRDGWLTARLTESGPYTVILTAGYVNQDGAYTLHRASAPGAFTTREGDEGGDLPNGAYITANLPLGDIDLWSFQANAGDRLHLRAGGTNFTPWIRIFDPQGAQAGQSTWSSSATRDGQINVVATNAGIYTVTIAAGYASQEGSYGLHLARLPAPFTVSPGDEGGPLANGVTAIGSLTLGDLDLWSFDAIAGETVFIRCGSPAFTPWVRIHGPNGVLIEESSWSSSATRDGVITLRTTTAGTHTVLVAAGYPGQIGDYSLHRASIPGDFNTSPGDDGGPLVNGMTNNATMPLGDLDIWSFVGTPGDSNVFRVTGTTFTPWLTVLAPDGAILRQSSPSSSATRQATVTLPITNAGIYTVVLTPYYPGQSGDYTFKQSRFPPDLILPESAELPEGTPLDIEISAQDPDEPNKPLQFALLSGPPGMALNLLGATNAQLTWATSELLGPSTNTVVATVTDVVDGRAFTRTNSFQVVVQEFNQAPGLQVPADITLDEGTPLPPGTTAVATDADLPANELTFSLADAPEGMTIDPVTGDIAWTPTEAQGPSDNLVAVVVTDFNPWAVNEQRISVTNTFRVTVREVNIAPTLTVPPATTIDEGTAFSATATAADPDLPANSLTFGLAAAPLGFAIDPASGVMAWTPAENQGPANYTIAVVVTDSNPAAANATRLSTTNTFVLSVREVNSPPRMTAIPETTLNEGDSLSVSSAATDDDLPANIITYTLASAPAGAAISTDGLVTWATSEADGPSTNRFVVVARDNGTPSLAATNAFTVIVAEINAAPTLAPIENLSVHYGSPISITAVGADTDLPANVLTYTLEGAPNGMTIDPQTGLISWTPASADVGEHPVTVRVTDDATPPASASVSFQVTVFGAGARLTLTLLPGGLKQVTSTGEPGLDYELQASSDLVAWERLVDFRMTATPAVYIDPASAGISPRFYRLRLRQQ